MGMNDTPSGERVHIGIFGCVNAGKSSLINAVTMQRLSIVSSLPGTTTDPVSKAMELLPLGPVMLTDTPGLDDESILAEKRRERTIEVLDSSDMALLVVDAVRGMREPDREILDEIRKRRIPYLIIYNKCDALEIKGGSHAEAGASGAESGSQSGVARRDRAGSSYRPLSGRTLAAEIYKAPNSVMNDVYLAPDSVVRDVYNPESRVVDLSAMDEESANRLVCVSSLTGGGIEELRSRMAHMGSMPDSMPGSIPGSMPGSMPGTMPSTMPAEGAGDKGKLMADGSAADDGGSFDTGVSSRPIISDLVKSGDLVILVIPIDEAAPKGRLILPQQQTIRELLEAGCRTVCVRDKELAEALEGFMAAGMKPSAVVTDSQAFEEVAKIVPREIRLTSFSILMARHKGNLKPALEGAHVIKSLGDGDRVLICEGCTHRRQCGDIGTVKLPAMIRKHCGHEPDFRFTSGRDFPDTEGLLGVRLVIHCGGCMLNGKEMQLRYDRCKRAGVPVTNYGIAIAEMKGIHDRAVFFEP